MEADQRAFIAQLYAEMFEKLMIYAKNNLENESLAEEAVQDTFQIACLKPEKLCESPNPQGWLVLTLRNVIRNMKSNRATAHIIVETYLLTQLKDKSYTVDQINVDLLYENIADLEAYQLLKELAIDGRSHLEMARDRGISVNTCKKRVQRAKEILQRKIGKDVTP